jgi:hypothetical protein
VQKVSYSPIMTLSQQWHRVIGIIQNTGRNKFISYTLTRIRKTKTQMKTITRVAFPSGAHVLCVDMLVGMVANVTNGTVRVQVQFVWTQLIEWRKRKGGIVVTAIDRQ